MNVTLQLTTVPISQCVSFSYFSPNQQPRRWWQSHMLVRFGVFKGSHVWQTGPSILHQRPAASFWTARFAFPRHGVACHACSETDRLREGRNVNTLAELLGSTALCIMTQAGTQRLESYYSHFSPPITSCRQYRALPLLLVPPITGNLALLVVCCLLGMARYVQSPYP